MEREVESASEFEEMFKRYSSDPEVREKAKGYTELWNTGRRELFRIVWSFISRQRSEAHTAGSPLPGLAAWGVRGGGVGISAR